MLKKALIFIVSLALFSGASHAEIYKIAVVKSRSLAPFDVAAGKTVQKLKELGIEAAFLYYDLQGDREHSPPILRQINEAKPHLVLTVGTLATRIIKEGMRNTPVVFTMVLNPVASGLVPSLAASGPNLTGVALDIPLVEQFANFRLVVPKAKRIGVIFNPKESGQLVNEAQSAAGRAGLILVPIPVDTSSEVAQKLERLKSLDGLWIPADSVVLTPRNSEFILLFTLKEKIPFMGISEEFVKAGALFGKSLDMESVYLQTAQLIARILKGEGPAQIPISTPSGISLTLNLRAAKMIDLEISPSVINEAGMVLE